MKHRIVVRRHRPWLRLSLIAGAVAALALGGYGLYRYTRATTVSDFARASSELQELRDERRDLSRRLRAAQAELAQAKSQLVYVQRSSSIDSQACVEVRESLASLQAEASGLREQLAFYRAVAVPKEAKAGVRVESLNVEALGGTRYRYRLMLIQAKRDEKRVDGRVAMAVRGRIGGSERTLEAAQLVAAETPDLVFSLKYFQELSGEWTLPEGFVAEQVIVGLVPAAGGSSGIEQTFDWQRVLSAQESQDEVQR